MSSNERKDNKELYKENNKNKKPNLDKKSNQNNFAKNHIKCYNHKIGNSG